MQREIETEIENANNETIEMNIQLYILETQKMITQSVSRKKSKHGIAF